MNLKKTLEHKLTTREIELLKKSFDTIGDTIILEIPDELKKKQKSIISSLLETHKNVKTIFKKMSDRKGEYRLRELKTIHGKGSETIHKEHGCSFKLDVKKVYFSPREATERQRIAQQVKRNEKILVMFSGVGPFAITIAKKQPECEIICIEINPIAVDYAKENVLINKIQSKIKNYAGDVREVCKNMRNFDRIIMPLPETAIDYLDVALGCAGKNCIIHVYGIIEEKDMFSKLELQIRKYAKNLNKKIRIVNRKKVLPYGPRKWKVCIDFKVLN